MSGDLQRALKCITMKSKRKPTSGKSYYGFYDESNPKCLETKRNASGKLPASCQWPCKEGDAQYDTGKLLKRFRDAKYPLTKTVKALQPAVALKVKDLLISWGFSEKAVNSTAVNAQITQAIEKVPEKSAEIQELKNAVLQAPTPGEAPGVAEALTSMATAIATGIVEEKAAGKTNSPEGGRRRRRATRRRRY